MGLQVAVHAGDLHLDKRGQIAVSADIANGGMLSIDATRDITLASNSHITAAAARTGGNISVIAGRNVQLRDSLVTAAAGDQGTYRSTRRTA